MIKIRPELLEVTTLEDAVTLGLASQKRYSSEPVFSKTGVAHLSPISIEDYAKEAGLISELQETLAGRLNEHGQGVSSKSHPSLIR